MMTVEKASDGLGGKTHKEVPVSDVPLDIFCTNKPDPGLFMQLSQLWP